jgi:hypothetical protein
MEANFTRDSGQLRGKPPVFRKHAARISVADPDPGSVIRDWGLFDTWIPDLGSRIPNSYF